eukprot:scaffold1065_cov114-Skeletonema_dohrnii-CCMP3373.AAC.20
MAAADLAREIILQSIPADRRSPFFLYFHSPSMAAGQRDALKITAPLQNGKTLICVEFVNKQVTMKFDVTTGLESAALICEGFMHNRTGYIPEQWTIFLFKATESDDINWDEVLSRWTMNQDESPESERGIGVAGKVKKLLKVLLVE